MRKLVRGALVIVGLGAVLAGPAATHLRASTLLMRVQGGETPSSGVLSWGAHAVDEEVGTLDTPLGPARTRTYVPRGVADPPAIVVAHGVHRAGVDEPRLQRFARALATAGVIVLTPELVGLTDYHVDLGSADTIGRAAQALAGRAHRTSVGVLGLSFAGGLSLLAASDQRWAPSIAFVVSVGAHDDLSRVSRFFFDDEIARPDGSTLHLHAHDYGAMVLVYGNVERFFPTPDVPAARDAIRLWLWEDKDGARVAAQKLSPASREKLEKLFDRKAADLKPELLGLVETSAPVMIPVSPHEHIGGVRVPVFLLHGQADDVIPSSETEWLAHDAPEGSVKNALVSPAVSHVSLQGEPSVKDKWDLVHFMAQVLEEAERETPTG
jgi:hypothetical protein